MQKQLRTGTDAPSKHLLLGVMLALTALLTAPAVQPLSAACVGDCGGDQSVTVEEIISMVTVALGTVSIDACRPGDANVDGDITVDEIIIAVNAALTGCPATGPDATGHWAGSVLISGSITQAFTFDLIQTGEQVTGTYASDFESGTITGTHTGGMQYSFTLSETTVGCPGTFTGTATVDGDSMIVAYSGSNCEGQFAVTGTADRVHLCTMAGETNCCGDNVREGRERCDGTDSPTCEELGFDGGHTICADCRLEQQHCFTAGQCIMGTSCGDASDCPTQDCSNGFAKACLNNICVLGSCACTDDLLECCSVTGGMSGSASTVSARHSLTPDALPRHVP